MKPYVTQELEKRGFFDNLLSGKPQENAWKEIGNILAAAEHVADIPADALKKAAAKWDVKFNERNTTKRSGIYRQLAEIVFGVMTSADDPSFKELSDLADRLGLSPQLAQLANRGAKNVAYGNRCRGILAGTEALDIHQLNKLFDYDYEDGLVARREVFEEHFYKVFEGFEKSQRYSLADEEALSKVAEKLDVPFELKENLMAALMRFRNLWNAETQDLKPIQVQFPLAEGEACYAGTNSGRCVKKVIEVADDFFDRNRKFDVEDTLAFKGGALDSKVEKQEHLLIEEMGYFFITNQRLIFASDKNVVQHKLADITGGDYKDNCIYFHQKDGDDVVYKYSDDASECMFMIFNRVKKGEIEISGQ